MSVDLFFGVITGCLIAMSGAFLGVMLHILIGLFDSDSEASKWQK